MTADEFGHKGIIAGGFCLDSWGTDPFTIEIGSKKFRFGDSDRFGPYLCDRHGDPIKNPYPGERSPFWRAHRIWKRQGRRTTGDNKTCVWDEPKPQVLCRIHKRNVIVDFGEEDGDILWVSEAERLLILAERAGKKS